MIGSALKSVRLNRELLQSEVCNGICDRSMLSKIESGNCNPSLRILTELCQRLNVQISDVYGCTDIPENTKELINYLKDLLTVREYDKAIKESKRLIKKCQISQDYYLEFNVLRTLGLAYYAKADYKQSLAYFNECQDLPNASIRIMKNF